MKHDSYLCPDCGTPHTINNRGCSKQKNASEFTEDKKNAVIKMSSSCQANLYLSPERKEDLKLWIKDQPKDRNERANYWLDIIRSFNPAIEKIIRRKVNV